MPSPPQHMLGAPDRTPGLVSVLVVNWNGEETLRACLSSVRGQTWESKQLVVVDNASQDASREILREFPEARAVTLERNEGFAGGNNQGLAFCRGEYIALLNNDAVAEPRWLETSIRLLAARPEVAAVGCVVRVWRPGEAPGDEGAPIDTSWTKIDPRTGAAFNFNDPRPEAPNDYLAGCAMVVRGRVIDEVGPLDAGYQAYYEETDWNARMIRCGHTLLFTPAACVWHRVQAGARQRARHFHEWMMCRNRVRFVLKNFDIGPLFLFKFAYAREGAVELWRSGPGARAGDPTSRREHLRRAVFLGGALGWNLVHLLSTLRARRRDLGRIRPCRSYNRNLPLRNVAPNR